jgi:excinuclease ABC subunit A
VCHGKRFNDATLRVTFKGKNIAQVLDLSVREAMEHFSVHKEIIRILKTLEDVGLGYIKIGQPSPTLSGGEAQRIKLATELQRTQRGSSLYVLDEPTTGLHPADVARLMTQLDGLVAAGNTVIVVEHEMRVVAGSDHVIDIGPGAGDEGGRIVAAGPPASVAAAPHSRTAPYLARFLAAARATRRRAS